MHLNEEYVGSKYMSLDKIYQEIELIMESYNLGTQYIGITMQMSVAKSSKMWFFPKISGAMIECIIIH